MTRQIPPGNARQSPRLTSLRSATRRRVRYSRGARACRAIVLERELGTPTEAATEIRSQRVVPRPLRRALIAPHSDVSARINVLWWQDQLAGNDQFIPPIVVLGRRGSTDSFVPSRIISPELGVVRFPARPERVGHCHRCPYGMGTKPNVEA
jgi:hypothetical protein